MSYLKRLVSLMVMGTITATTITTAFADNMGIITEDSVKIRNEASIDSNESGILNLGETVEILDMEGDHYRIAMEGIEKAFVLGSSVNIYEADGVVVGDNVIVRSEATSDSEQVGSLGYGDKIIVNGIVDDFYRIKFDDADYFVHSSFVYGDMIYSVQKIELAQNPKAQKGTYAIVLTDTGLNFREEASTDSKTIRVFSQNDIVDVVENGDEWTKISIVVVDDADGTEEVVTGYVSTEYLVVQTGAKPEATKYTKNTASAKADAVIEYAEKFLGTPYSWGGTNLSKGVDCSGFVYSVMKAHGVSLNRSSRDQYSNGTRVSKSDLQKGDLIFFDTTGSNNGGISHVGIYIGGGTFIHSSSGKQWGITKSNLSETYYVRAYVGATRVL